MDSPTSIRSKPPQGILSPCGSQRRRSSCDSNPPEFEFWRLTNSSFHQPDSDLLSADELFHDGVILPLQLLSIKYEPQPDPNASECEPDPSPSPATLITEQKTEPEPGLGLGSELTREPTGSKRWRDIFRKSEDKPAVKKREEKVNEKKKKEKKTGSGTGPGPGPSSAAELNINIWPFSRSRSAGNNVTRPRMSFGASTTRKISSAPCSRSNSTGESKSRKWPNSPSRNGVHLGRSSPVWQVRRAAPPTVKTVSDTMGRVVSKRAIPETRRGKTVSENNKAKVINLNVRMCIGYRSRLRCRNDESGNSNTIGTHNNTPNPNGLFGFRNPFIKKVH